MKTIEFENKVFYALKGFDGYYASMDGEVLGTKKGMKLLKCSMGICQAYSLCRHNKITKVTKARIAYMVQNDCSLAELNGYYVGIKQGKAVKSENKKEVEPKRFTDPLKEIHALRNEIELLEGFYISKDIKQIKAYIDSEFENLVLYAVRLNRGRNKAIALVKDALSNFYVNLYNNMVTRGIISYVKGIMRKTAAIERKEAYSLVHSELLYDKISLNDWVN